MREGEREGNLDGPHAGEFRPERRTPLIGARPEHEPAVGVVDRGEELTEEARPDHGPVEIDHGRRHATDRQPAEAHGVDLPVRHLALGSAREDARRRDDRVEPGRVGDVA